MDHKAFAATLPAETIARLNQRADAPGLRHLAAHAGMILSLGMWIALGLPLWQVAMVLQGIAICFLFTLEHEATHKTPFRTAALNEWVGRVCGVMIVVPFEWFRYFHLAHHRYTNDLARDPELLAGGRPGTLRAYLIHVSGLPFWISMVAQLTGNALGRDPGAYVPVRARGRIRIEARWMLVIYALAMASLFFTPLLIWVWILPCLLGQPFLRLYLLAEHGRCAAVANMLENTRTTYTNRLVRRLAWNMPYHVEHHTLPQVPFHQLPRLHACMKGHHKVTAEGYVAFNRDYVAGLSDP